MQAALRKIMRKELMASKSRNSNYSLRAFARRLGISASAASEIMAGKRKVSKELAERLLSRMAIDPHTQSRVFAPIAQVENLDEMKELSFDHFNIISEWHHFAILHLLETADAKPEPGWLAKRLGLPGSKVASALQSLERLEIIEKDKKGAWRPTGLRYRTSDEVTSLALQKSHRLNLEKAADSLQQDPLDLRDFTASTFALDPKLIPEIKIKIRRFHGELLEMIESGEKTEVYKVCLQLFPLTKRQEK